VYATPHHTTSPYPTTPPHHSLHHTIVISSYHPTPHPAHSLTHSMPCSTPLHPTHSPHSPHLTPLTHPTFLFFFIHPGFVVSCHCMVTPL
jgi:hypothetical protein